VYNLTSDGRNLLNFTEDSLNFICRKIGTPGVSKGGLAEDTIAQPALRPLLKKMEQSKPLL
jgi:hypothetical protein